MKYIRRRVSGKGEREENVSISYEKKINRFWVVFHSETPVSTCYHGVGRSFRVEVKRGE